MDFINYSREYLLIGNCIMKRSMSISITTMNRGTFTKHSFHDDIMAFSRRDVKWRSTIVLNKVSVLLVRTIFAGRS